MPDELVVQLKELHLKNFRCFQQRTVSFERNLILITGDNGSGKTSLLEAMYYMGYLTSFRTHNARDLIHLEAQDFFIKARIDIADYHSTHEMQVGFSDRKRIVRIDQKSISSYKELISLYRVIALTEDDVMLIKGEPELRRTFLDQTCMFMDAESTARLRAYRTILHNRNTLLSSGSHDEELMRLWTEQLWKQTVMVQQQRQQALTQLGSLIQSLGTSFLGDNFSCELVYVPKIAVGGSLEEFIKDQVALFAQEKRYKRSLFGAHLDDFHLYLQHKKSRVFASRGQQKCALILLKVAQALLVSRLHGPCIMLLDDFMTDFDAQRIERLIPMLIEQRIQLIFTAPTSDSPLVTLLGGHGAQHINIF